MDCAQIRQQLDAYEDGELDAVRSREFEAHLLGCPDCLRAEERLIELRHALRKHATYHPAPAELREAAMALVHPPTPRTRHGVTLRWWQLGGLLSGSASAAALCVLVALHVASPTIEQQMAAELVNDHIRSLVQDHLLDVASTDQHTVKPWFAGKLDYSPPVRDLADAGFPLVGGRLDYVDGRLVAALVYQRHQHRINVFVWPAKGGTARSEHVTDENGYNVIGWRTDGMDFWAVSDLNSAELQEFRVGLGRG
jgi:anti-sigma factor (TIGR02949 family)